MRPSGTIYDSGRAATRGELILVLPGMVRILYQLIRSTGAGMIAVSFLLFMFSYGPILSKEASFKFKSILGESTTSYALPYEEVVKPENFTEEIAEVEKIIEVQEEAGNYGVNSYFSLVIPKIDAKANVISNVDTTNKAEYLDALSKGISHAKGTYFPGQDGRVFLFSHSTDSPVNFTRFNAIFYLLKELEEGDEIIIYFADKKHVYEVKETVITKPTDTSWLMPKSGEEELVLMTCDPPGTTWNRLLVIAKPKPFQ